MNLTRTLLIGASALTLAVAASACSSTSGDGAGTESPTATTGASGRTAQQYAVGISNSRFETTELIANVGDTVTFRNDDGYDHTVTSTADAPVAFDSGEFGQDETFVIELTAPGTYDYFCEIHPTMRASVVVG